MSPFMIYLAMQADSLRTMACACIVLFGVTMFSLGLAVFITESSDLLKKALAVTKWPMILAFAILMFVPETKSIIAMTTIPTIMENENVKALPNEVLSLLRSYVDEEKKKRLENQ